MNNYFRITGYWPKENLTFIVDSNGMFEKLWQFSAYLVSKGIDIKEVSKNETLHRQDIEIIPEIDREHIFLREYKK